MKSDTAVAIAADTAAVVTFCTIGRRSHAEGLTVKGIATTTWPFLTGTAVGWVLSRGWRKPAAVTPTGLVVWVCTVLVGMVLRKLTAAPVAASFIVVASSVTAAFLLGWRLLFGRWSHRDGQRRA
ncbi:hypothetical protein BVC93_15250 [Mycobacterium sp. MS1601]|uniref:DUF3054 domain-containing protein n=1 Tax=Mycobacterium sp. MS1601 TaxID=1936029 RepID=UPI0009793D84|nr:DUF3054 domain-containing protein [Mycobacterium sp. MS1601]AQA03545.1 hypothetical protein BVC93_15250 [Mycobacterium sp. MS1601]